MVFFDSFHFYPAISLRVNTVFFVACIILSVSEQFTYCCEHGRGKVERAGELPWFSSLNRNTLIHLSLLSMTRKYFGQIFVQIVFHLCKGGRVGPLPQVVANRSGQLSHWKQKLNKNWVLNFFRDKWKWYPHDGYPWWKWVKQGCRLVNCSLVKAPGQMGMKSHLKESK